MSTFQLSPSFASLDLVRERMGAPLIKWESDYVNETSIMTSRVSFTVNSLEELTENIGYRSDKILIDKKDNSVVVLYIKDHRRSGHELQNDPSLGNKIHLTWCQTLEMMTRKDSFDKYVATKRTSGLFEVEYHSYYGNESGTVDIPLHVCTHCLRALKIDTREKGRYDFVKHLERYSDTPMFKKATRYTDLTAPENNYPHNWDEVSHQFRKIKNWKCEDCGVDLKNHPSLLDTHHRNGLKHDITPKNLQALCKVCHKKRHPHYIIPENAITQIQSLKGV